MALGGSVVERREGTRGVQAQDRGLRGENAIEAGGMAGGGGIGEFEDAREGNGGGEQAIPGSGGEVGAGFDGDGDVGGAGDGEGERRGGGRGGHVADDGVPAERRASVVG